ncbi:hypothetical protein C0J52_17217 [Blattella germanica]|nr:hypothetical protein C0J52_17217 [Blattella germanica]
MRPTLSDSGISGDNSGDNLQFVTFLNTVLNYIASYSLLIRISSVSKHYKDNGELHKKCIFGTDCLVNCDEGWDRWLKWRQALVSGLLPNFGFKLLCRYLRPINIGSYIKIMESRNDRAVVIGLKYSFL